LDSGALTWVATDGRQELPLNNALIEIELKESRRRSAFSRERLDYDPTKYKVIVPTLVPRVEKTHEGAAIGVARTYITPLPNVASKAGIGEVAGLR
jgi:hypothetical protein